MAHRKKSDLPTKVCPVCDRWRIFADDLEGQVTVLEAKVDNARRALE